MSVENIFLFGEVALWAFILIVAVMGGLRGRAYFYRVSPGELAFRKPFEMRAVLGAFGLISVATPFWVGIEAWKQQDGNACAMLPFFAALCFGFGALFFSLAGPADLYLDMERRTYRLVRGWPFLARTRSGTWEDFWGVWVGRTSGSQTAYLVGVTWWGGGGSVTLGRFENKSSAERFAEEMMSKMDLKRVIPPRHLRPMPSCGANRSEGDARRVK